MSRCGVERRDILTPRPICDGLDVPAQLMDLAEALQHQPQLGRDRSPIVLIVRKELLAPADQGGQLASKFL